MSPRTLLLVGASVCTLSLLFAYFYLEKTLGLAPCPLCVFDRLVFALLAIFFFIGFIHNPQQLGQRLYASLAIVLSAIGIGLAARHIYLQNLPPDKVPGCLPDLGFMLDEFPLLETIQTVLSSAGECAEIDWTLLGMTIPQQTLLVFILVAVLSLILFFKKSPSSNKINS
ncbi:MAG: disulfide bond formation protein B [Candidatus Oxydemutatoraceae bacterium WSBS_2016_MAG_OTU14]